MTGSSSRLEYGDKSSYEGDFKDGKRHGEGTFTFNDESKYVGKWINDLKHGEGTYTWSDGTKLVGTWENGEHVDGQLTEKDLKTKRHIVGSLKRQ